MKKKRHINLSTKYIILLCVLLLAIDLVFGTVMLYRTSTDMQIMTRNHMLSVANTAARVVDANTLDALTKEDLETDENGNRSAVYHQIANVLLQVQKAQNDENIKYIYTVTKMDGEFVFLLDPDPVDPADFGEPMEAVTPMLVEAWETGEGRVDKEKYEDEWGNFYTAWSPVWKTDNAGNRKLVAIVGVDFGADVYDAELARMGWSIGLVSFLSLIVGSVVVALLTMQISRRFRKLNTELSTLSTNVESLSAEIGVRPGDEETNPEEPENLDSISSISEKVRDMQKKLKRYMEYVQEQAFTDRMTGVGNKTAYLDRVKEINEEINRGDASFAIVVFDINGLKSTNDNYGHECGDRIITDAAKVICRVFPKQQIYRIGGDEFIALVPSESDETLKEKFEQLKKEIDRFNREEKKYAMTLSFSWGESVYRPGDDAAVKAVFKRADEEMYRNKNEYYKHSESNETRS